MLLEDGSELCAVCFRRGRDLCHEDAKLLRSEMSKSNDGLNERSGIKCSRNCGYNQQIASLNNLFEVRSFWALSRV